MVSLGWGHRATIKVKVSHPHFTHRLAVKQHFLTSDCFDESRFATNVKNSNMLVVISAKVLVLVESSCPTTSVPEELLNSSFVSIFTTLNDFKTRTNL